MYQRTIVKVATVALAAAASSAAVSAENSATSHINNNVAAAAHHDHPVGTPVASVDAKPSPSSSSSSAVPEQQLTNQEKNARVREAARNLVRKKAELAAEEAAAAAGGSSPSKAERKRRAAENMRNFSPEHGTAERLSAGEINRLVHRAKETDPEGKLPQNQWIRRMAWYDFGGMGDGVPSDYKPYDDGYADPGYDWPMWAQAYRMLGGFIDCDWQQGEEEPGGGGEGGRKRRMNQNGEERDLSGDGGTEDACGRWMMWAAVSQVAMVIMIFAADVAVGSSPFNVMCGFIHLIGALSNLSVNLTHLQLSSMIFPFNNNNDK